MGKSNVDAELDGVHEQDGVLQKGRRPFSSHTLWSRCPVLLLPTDCDHRDHNCDDYHKDDDWYYPKQPLESSRSVTGILLDKTSQGVESKRQSNRDSSKR